MKKICGLLLVVCVLFSCSDSDEVVVSQKSERSNVEQLKKLATSLGWNVSSDVVEDVGVEPLSDEEKEAFANSLDRFNIYPNLKQEREIVIVPLRESYTWAFINSAMSTKAKESKSIFGTAKWNNTTDPKYHILVEAKYDIEEGCITYAFAGTGTVYFDDSSLSIYRYVTFGDHSSWSCTSITTRIYVNFYVQKLSFPDYESAKRNPHLWPTNVISEHREKLLIEGSFDITNNTSYFTVTSQGEGRWEITTRVD